MKYTDHSFKDCAHIQNNDQILLVTATDTESRVLHNYIKPQVGECGLLRIYEGENSYYIGRFGCYSVVHLQCAMGAASRGSSTLAVNNAIQLFSPKAVLMIGIAFGIKETKQTIGDVLVSESIIPYGQKRIGENENIQRGIESQASRIFLNRFQNLRTWEHYIGDSTNKSKVFYTRLLSGEELIDNLKRRSELESIFPDSLGGEMEGVGVASACGSKLDWIIVKGICDFANGKKGVNKEANQIVAMESAVSICHELFSSPFALSELAHPAKESQQLLHSIAAPDLELVLFDYYDCSKEMYYIVRAEDDAFCNAYHHYGVWLYGPTGCGKSNLIIRNLIQSQRRFIQVNLSPCVGSDILLFFVEIYYELYTNLTGTEAAVSPQSFSECTKLILRLLKTYAENQELIIFIEEIPIGETDTQQEFTEKLFALVISKAFQNGLSRIRFILSSINNPIQRVTQSQAKIHQHFKFTELHAWEAVRIEQLIDLIQKNIKFALPADVRTKLVSVAAGSPRFVKKYFRNIFAGSSFATLRLMDLVDETARELNHEC